MLNPCPMFQVSVHTLPAPAFVLLAQLTTSALAVWLAGALGFVVVDKLELKKVRARRSC